MQYVPPTKTCYIIGDKCSGRYWHVWSSFTVRRHISISMCTHTHTHTQYFSTFDPNNLEPDHVPWLPLSVVCPPVAAGGEPNSQAAPHDEESSLKALLSELGPGEGARGETLLEGESSTQPQGEAVGGLVRCLLLPRDADCGEDVLSGGCKKSVQLQRIASRCHCHVVYVTYGSHVDSDTQSTVSSSWVGTTMSCGLCDLRKSRRLGYAEHSKWIMGRHSSL